LIGLDCCEHEKILQILVVGETRIVKDNSLKEINQLMRQLSGHESLHCARDFIGVLGLWQGSLNNLLDDVLSVLVVWHKDLAPESFVLSFDQVSGLKSVQEVAVGDLNELLVALAPSSLVGSVSQVWVTLFGVFSDYLRIIVLVVDQEVLWVLVDVDVDFGQSIVESWFLDALVTS